MAIMASIAIRLIVYIPRPAAGDHESVIDEVGESLVQIGEPHRIAIARPFPDFVVGNVSQDVIFVPQISVPKRPSQFAEIKSDSKTRAETHCRHIKLPGFLPACLETLHHGQRARFRRL